MFNEHRATLDKAAEAAIFAFIHSRAAKTVEAGEADNAFGNEVEKCFTVARLKESAQSYIVKSIMLLATVPPDVRDALIAERKAANSASKAPSQQ